ncbi:hypothetical protein NQZ68_011375 [Dissostichus eleginoides]|nr:hypothetical protein NQZ68_011375 [Dissostichus eleginoides]
MIATVHDAVAPCNIYRSAPAMCQHQADLALPRSAATAACEQEEEQMLVSNRMIKWTLLKTRVLLSPSDGEDQSEYERFEQQINMAAQSLLRPRSQSWRLKEKALLAVCVCFYL